MWMMVPAIDFSHMFETQDISGVCKCGRNCKVATEGFQDQLKHNRRQIFHRGNALLFDVFSNLLNNAVKFDGHDIVEIDVGISSSGDDWAIEFKDRGHGIGYDYKKIIFNRMEMAGESTQGSGLGLTIVKYIVESYGGNIWVEDRVRGDLTQGSNFIVLLPKGEGTNHGKNIHRG